ncbi:hypothetical protein [Winogradskyella sp. A2]|uniref:DUF922 domain-containing protein n=1 Tax=Winogradskyella sp. A2 TaxID=3366944 RepID=UPI00398C46D6
MKKLNVLLLFLLALSCSPKLKSNVITSFNPLEKDDLVIVLKISDDQLIEGDKVGSVKATDNGMSVNCTYYENINSLKKLAMQSGANVIKITRQKIPDKWSTCNRLWADIYRVDDPKLLETQIEWSEDRKLTWDDFKGKPDRENYPNALALTNSGFGYESGNNMFKEGEVFVQSVFNTNSSWVLQEGRTDYVLRHEQIHFDITEIYSRKLRKELADAKVTSSELLRAKTIFDKVFNEMQKRQEKYDRETARGDKTETQENWEAIV